jgi:hypothetical protein
MDRHDRRRIMRAPNRRASMDKINKLFLDLSTERMWPNSDFNKIYPNSMVHIEDKRVARLLLVLHELDQSVAGLEGLPKTELSELVSSAIWACGFVGSIEARYAIAAVLEMIETNDSMPESS